MRSSACLSLVLFVCLSVAGDDLSRAVRSLVTGRRPAEVFRSDLATARAEEDARAALWLARLHHRGRCGVVRDVRHAHALATAAIETVATLEDDPEALFLIGAVYHEGLGVLPDYDKAVAKYRLAVSHGHPAALVNLGICHEFGQGVPRSREAAIGLYRQAFRLGSVRAGNNLLRLGENPHADAASEKPSRKIAALTPPVYRPKGEVYEIIGHLTRADWPDDKVIAGLRRLAQAGDAIATMWLARLQFRGRAVLPADPERAQKTAKDVFPKVQALADAGDPEAQFLVAAGHHFGLGVPLDLARAAAGYEAPAAAGHISAMNNLAFCLAHGLGVIPDIERADGLFRRAVRAGSRRAGQNRRNYRGHDREMQPAQRDLLRRISTVPMTHVIGMEMEAGITFLELHGVIRSPKRRQDSGSGISDPVIHFPADGIRLRCNLNRRIKMIEVHGNGYSGSEHFAGELPYGVTFKDDRDAALKKMGRPVDGGWVPDFDLYGMAYSTGRVNASVMFPLTGKGNLLCWTVFEKWSVARPDWRRDLD